MPSLIEVSKSLKLLTKFRETVSLHSESSVVIIEKLVATASSIQNKPENERSEKDVVIYEFINSMLPDLKKAVESYSAYNKSVISDYVEALILLSNSSEGGKDE